MQMLHFTLRRTRALSYFVMMGCRIRDHMGNPFGPAPFKDGKNGLCVGTNFRHILFRLCLIQYKLHVIYFWRRGLAAAGTPRSSRMRDEGLG